MHTTIINHFKALGYPETKGLCHGLAIRWLEACLLNEEHRFLKRIDYLNAKTSIELKEDFNRITAKKGRHLTPEDLKIFDVMAFFDSLAIFNLPSHYIALTSRLISQTNISLTSYFASSNKIFDRGGLLPVYSESGIYNLDELKDYLEKLTALLANLTIHQEETVNVLLNSIDHSVALTYSKSVGWKFMDSNQYPPKKATKTELVRFIATGFFLPKDSLSLAFTTTIITAAGHHNVSSIRDQLNQLNQHDSLTEEKAFRESYPSSLIFLIAKNNELPKLNQLIAFNVDLNVALSNGATATYIAAHFGYAAFIDILAKNNADLNKALNNGMTPTCVAAQYGHVDAIIALAKNSADLDKALANGATPVSIAASLGHADVIALLAQYRADMNKALDDEATPLYLAARNGHAAVIAELLKHHVDLNKAVSNGSTPAFAAAKNGHAAVIDEFIKHHNLNKAIQNKQLLVIDKLQKQRVDFNLGVTQTENQLIAFVSTKGEAVLKRMKAFIAKQTQTKNIIMTPFDIAIVMGHNEIARLIKVHLNLSDSEKKTVLKHTLFSQPSDNQPYKKVKRNATGINQYQH